MLIIGIDPGIKGAICILKDGKILDVFDMPIMPVGKKNKSQVNGSQIYNEIQKAITHEDKKDIKVVIEDHTIRCEVDISFNVLRSSDTLYLEFVNEEFE